MSDEPARPAKRLSRRRFLTLGAGSAAALYGTALMAGATPVAAARAKPARAPR
ncbi:MAG: hypothetical protein HOP12_13000, partial [Candidatus Eisenbacteria bacterium]|nr:hypothetical protein [Candidatus Eisenbacteria bacterium]